MTEVSFGEWLKRQRSGRGLTQEQLAQQIGCAAITLRKIESEERRPSAQIVQRLADIFEIPRNEQERFLRYARGDFLFAPADSVAPAPWLASQAGLSPSIQLATFLFTDIEGSAKLWDYAPEQMKDALQRHHAILQDTITSNSGNVFQIVGDAFCAAFPTVISAISAAVQAQLELYREPWDTPFPICVRMGIHTGEAERSSDNPLLGGYASNQTLNRVARILSAGHGGQILLSLATKDLVKDSLPADTALRDMGEHHLRNLTHPEHLFQLNIAGLPSDFPPLNTLTRRHNLPIQLTSFIAREGEVALVHEYLLREDIRLVTLSGPAGIGKTRLSLASARVALSDFPDGVFFIALAPLEDPNLIASAIVQALGYVETANLSLKELLINGIGDKEMLLVLDNCEHLISEVATLAADLLSACAQLKILATSRESLRIPGEWLYAIPTLATPEEGSAIDVKAASQFAALTLFAERARAVRSDFTLGTDNLQEVSAICSRLDGLPLAIELIAPRIRLMTPRALLERMNDQFILSADGSRNVPVRQQTLQHAIDWSYRMLSEEEQKFFARLAVFSGGFTLDAAEAIFSQTVTGKSISDLMLSLLDKSLLQRVTDQKVKGDSRFNMLVTIQHFALERLRNMGEVEIVHDWHLKYFLGLAEKADREIHGPHQVEWLDILETEHDNYRAVLNWCITNGNLESALFLIGSFSDLGRFWSVRSYFSEARDWFDKVRASPDVTLYPIAYATTLNGMSFIAFLHGELGSVHDLAEESQRICQPIGLDGELGLAGALLAIGLAAMWGDNDIVRAEACHEQAAAIYQAHDNHWGQAFALLRLGITACLRRNYEKSWLFFEDSLSIFRELDDAFGLGRVHAEMSNLFLIQGNYDQARRLREQSLYYDKKLQFNHSIQSSLLSLGIISRLQGDYDQAEVYLGESASVCREINLLDDPSSFYLGCVNLHRGDYTVARAHLIEFIRINHRQGVHNQIGDGLFGLAAAAAGLQQYERTARLVGAGQAIHDAIGGVMELADRIEIDPLLQIAHEKLGEEGFEALAAEGHAMTLEQAVAYALEN